VVGIYEQALRHDPYGLFGVTRPDRQTETCGSGDG